jgi:hypothetical protein
MIGENDEEAVAEFARRLCLPRDRRHELDQLLARIPPPTAREVVTFVVGSPTMSTLMTH